MSLNIPTLHKIEEIKTENGEVKTFKFHSPEIARESEPGQFVMVWNPGIDEIPISIANTSPEGDLELAIADVGDCSHSLHQKHVGDLVGLRGPYGRGFRLQGERICMVAGGYGAAPLRFAAKRARELGKLVVVLEGVRTRAELLYIHDFDRTGCSKVKIATEDGSEGYKGTVTALLELLFASGEKYELVLTCGPEPMMKRVCEITSREKIPAQVSVERIVKCGCGACGSCDLGGYRVCKDGPVFDAEALKMTEFGKWNREKSGKRIAITPQSTNVLSIPPSPFTPEYDPLLKTDVCGIGFPNPIANAAGFGVSGKLLYRYAVAGAGAVVTKSIGLNEQEGYPNPTFFELSPHSRSYVNAMGLPNPGIKNYGIEIEDAKYADVPLILSIFGKNVDECRQVAEIAVEYPIDMLEFNASCPHSDFVAVENNPKLLRQIIKVLRDIAHPKGISVAVKISPNVGDPAGFAVRLEQAGADAITAINTVLSRPVDPTLDIPLLGNPTGYGGKSGRDLTAGGKKTVFDLYKELKIPIIAVGGIFSGKDVIEYAKNGASLFQVGSALVSEGHEIYSTIKMELKEYLVANGHKNIGEIVGEAHRR